MPNIPNSQANYIDGFVFPIPKQYIEDYKVIAQQVAEIWKEHGALAYFEYIGDELSLEGVKSFTETLKIKDNEVVIFGWVVFPSKDIRDSANKNVPKDPRMSDLVVPLINPKRLIFDASRMVYGGFKPLINCN